MRPISVPSSARHSPTNSLTTHASPLPALASPQDLEAIFDASKKKKKRKPAAAAAGDDGSAAAGAGRQVAAPAKQHTAMNCAAPATTPLPSPLQQLQQRERGCGRGRGRRRAGGGLRGRAERLRLQLRRNARQGVLAAAAEQPRARGPPGAPRGRSAAVEAGGPRWRGQRRCYGHAQPRVHSLALAAASISLQRKKLKPPEVMRVGTTRSAWVNFRDCCAMMKRAQEHVVRFRRGGALRVIAGSRAPTRVNPPPSPSLDGLFPRRAGHHGLHRRL